jgi:hypothetical protein
VLMTDVREEDERCSLRDDGCSTPAGPEGAR